MEQNKTEAERANAEVTKANEAVEGLELVSQQVEEATKNTAPMTGEDIENLGNGLIDVEFDGSSGLSSAAEPSLEEVISEANTPQN